MERIWLSLGTMGGREQDYIQSAFDTNWVVPLGPNVDGFERDLESYLGEDVWKPLHMQPVFSACPAYVDGTAESLFNCGLSLPSSPALTDADVERVAREIIRFAG